MLVEARLRGLAQTQFGQSECARVEAAVRLARHAHYGQSRKQGGPYIIHPLRVAVSLVEEFGPSDADLVVAALLHDVLEDGPDRVSPQDIESACGKQVLELVQFLTSPTEAAVADKAERNRLKAEKVRQGPREAWCIKLADRIDNLRDACLLSAPDLRPFRTRYYEESLQYYLPLAEQLGNDRLRSALHSAMSKLQQ